MRMKQPPRKTTYLTQKSAAFWAAQVNHHNHLRMALEDADPHELIDRLYGNLLDHLSQGLKAVQLGDLAGKTKWLTLSLLTVNTLKITLKHDWHPGLADNLRLVYAFVSRQLSWGLVELFSRTTQAQLEQQLVLILEMLKPLALAWKELTLTARDYREQQPGASG